MRSRHHATTVLPGLPRRAVLGMYLTVTSECMYAFHLWLLWLSVPLLLEHQGQLHGALLSLTLTHDWLRKDLMLSHLMCFLFCFVFSIHYYFKYASNTLSTVEVCVHPHSPNGVAVMVAGSTYDSIVGEGPDLTCWWKLQSSFACIRRGSLSCNQYWVLFPFKLKGSLCLRVVDRSFQSKPATGRILVA